MEESIQVGSPEALALGAFEDGATAVCIEGWPKKTVLDLKLEGVAAEVAVGLVNRESKLGSLRRGDAFGAGGAI